MWVKVAHMHFIDAAARWVQSVEPQLRSMSWLIFCQLVHERFGQDQHQLLIRQLFHIRQDGTIKEYVDRFVELIDQLASYNTSTDALYYVTRFIDGLRDDICAVILGQCPQTLDTAYTLALL